VLAEPDRRGAIHSYDMARRSTGMRIPDPFGLGAPPPPKKGVLQTLFNAGEFKAKSLKFVDHPILMVGPWGFNPKGSKIEIRDGRLSSRGPYMQFLWKGIAQTTLKKKYCTMSHRAGRGYAYSKTCVGGTKAGRGPENYRGWGARGTTLSTQGGPLEEYGIYVGAINGKTPIYVVENPLDPSDAKWGIFVTRHEHSFTVEFKKIERSWWSKLVGWIKIIVGFVVDTVKALFDFMGIVACSLARQHLGEVANFAAGKVALSSTTAGWLKNTAGVTDQELDIVETGARASVSQMVANKIISAACGAEEQPPMGTAEQALPGWVIPAAIGAAGLAVVWLVTR
jgi:hypothetical protein